jgi:hypothetical protein
MRTLLIALVVAASPFAAAAQGLSQDRRPAKPLPAPAPTQTQTQTKTGSNPCAAFGPGFVQVDGGATCVKLGGGIGVGIGGSSRR